MKLPILRNLMLALGCASALSSCEVFKKDPAPAADPYAAANPYGQTPQPATGGYPAYGAPQAGAYDATGGAGAYAQPNYNTPPAQPYTQPPAAGAGYAGGYYDGGSASGGGNNYAASGSGRSHKVVRGDTLSSIGRRYGVGVSALMRANNLNSDLIREGQSLNIP